MSGERALARVTAQQAGVFHRRQALTVGYTPHQIAGRLATGTWSAPLPALYRATTTPMTRLAWRWAAVLWARGAVLAAATAAEMWEFDALPRSPQPHILVPGASRLHSPYVRTHRSDASLQLDRRTLEGLPLTSPELTVIHVATSLDAEQLEAAFESARRQRLLTAQSMERCLTRVGARGRGGTAAVRRLLVDVGNDAPSESVLEVKVARLLRKRHVSRSVRQYEIGAFRVDFAWPHVMLALECDGRRHHSDPADFQRDRTKWSALAALGWRVVVVTWADVTQRPDDVVSRLRHALAYAA